MWNAFLVLVGLTLLPLAVSLFGRLKSILMTMALSLLALIFIVWLFMEQGSSPLLFGLVTSWALAWWTAFHGIRTKRSSREHARLRRAVRQLYFWHRYRSGRGKNAALWPSPLDRRDLRHS